MSENYFFVSATRGCIVKNCFNGFKTGRICLQLDAEIYGCAMKEVNILCFNFTGRILRYIKTFLRVSE